MGIWLVATDGDMIKVDELVYLYRLKASKEHGYYELLPWERRTRIVWICLHPSDTGNPSSSLCLGMIERRPLTNLG